jgi:ABC-type antimicrobial peptide transport system permease subunit
LVAGPMMQTILIESGSNDTSSNDQDSNQQFQPGQFLNPPTSSPSMDSITSLEFSVDARSIAMSFGLTIIMGIIGALYPIMGALRMQPADALRYE